MSKLKGLIILIGGLVLMGIGLGMWQSPEFNWESFLAVWSLLGDNLAKLIHDPFAILGVIVIITGFLIAVRGFRHLVRG